MALGETVPLPARQRNWELQAFWRRLSLMLGQVNVLHWQWTVRDALRAVAFIMGWSMVIYPIYVVGKFLAADVLIASPPLLLTAIAGVVGIGLSRRSERGF